MRAVTVAADTLPDLICPLDSTEEPFVTMFVSANMVIREDQEQASTNAGNILSRFFDIASMEVYSGSTLDALLDKRYAYNDPQCSIAKNNSAATTHRRGYSMPTFLQ
jgi:hypothetical protein